MSKIGKVGKRKKTGGRKKGTPNKISLTVKQAVIETFSNLGGIEHMTAWARKQPTEFYRLAGRLIPTEITGQGGGPVLVTSDPQEIARRMLFLLNRGAVAGDKKLEPQTSPQTVKKLTVVA